MEEIERSHQVQLTINTDAMMNEIIKKAEKKKKQSFNQPTSKKEKIVSIRDNKHTEKQLNRVEEKFDLSLAVVSDQPDIIDFVTKEKVQDDIPKKSSSRLMEKLKKKRDEKFGKDE